MDESERPPGDVACFIDESGDRGYLRNLRPDQDGKVCVLCALPIPVEHLDYARAQVRPAFDRFVAAAPDLAKLHITDAFKRGNEAWGHVAREARREIFDFILQRNLRVVYAARRFKVAREKHEFDKQLNPIVEPSASPAPQIYAVPGANRPSDEQVDDQVMVDLSLLIDGFMEQAERRTADFLFDQIDVSVADRYMRMLERTRNVSYRRYDVPARNLQTGETETRSIQMRADAGFRLDTIHLGSVAVAGKTDPLVFAADVVANCLWRHLAALPRDAALNDGTAIKGWALEPITFYDRSFRPSPMDRL